MTSLDTFCFFHGSIDHSWALSCGFVSARDAFFAFNRLPSAEPFNPPKSQERCPPKNPRMIKVRATVGTVPISSETPPLLDFDCVEPAKLPALGGQLDMRLDALCGPSA